MSSDHASQQGGQGAAYLGRIHFWDRAAVVESGFSFEDAGIVRKVGRVVWRGAVFRAADFFITCWHCLELQQERVKGH